MKNLEQIRAANALNTANRTSKASARDRGRVGPGPAAARVYDLALVKLLVGRPKDLDLLHALLRLGILEPVRLRAHYQPTPLEERAAVVAGRNLTLLLRDIGAD